MNPFFDFEQDTVYAPGMTCVYEQLFHGLYARPWKAYPFSGAEEGPPAYASPEVVLENLFRGEVERTSALFAEPARFRRENPLRVEYDVLAIDSRWLTSHDALFASVHWGRLSSRLEDVRDRRFMFVDCQYPHVGYLQNIAIVRSLSAEEINRQARWQADRQALLEMLSAFPRFRYLSVGAMSAYFGYRTSCADQPDHYRPAFREAFRTLLRAHSEDRVLANVRAFVSIEESVEGRDTEIRLLGGPLRSFGAGDVVLKLRVRVKADDSLLCDTELLATWVALVEGAIEWRENFEVDPTGVVRPRRDGVDENTPKIVLKSLDDSIKIATLGRYTLSVHR